MGDPRGRSCTGPVINSSLKSIRSPHLYPNNNFDFLLTFVLKSMICSTTGRSSPQKSGRILLKISFKYHHCRDFQNRIRLKNFGASCKPASIMSPFAVIMTSFNAGISKSLSCD